MAVSLLPKENIPLSDRRDVLYPLPIVITGCAAAQTLSESAFDQNTFTPVVAPYTG